MEIITEEGEANYINIFYWSHFVRIDVPEFEKPPDDSDDDDVFQRVFVLLEKHKIGLEEEVYCIEIFCGNLCATCDSKDLHPLLDNTGLLDLIGNTAERLHKYRHSTTQERMENKF